MDGTTHWQHPGATEVMLRENSPRKTSELRGVLKSPYNQEEDSWVPRTQGSPCQRLAMFLSFQAGELGLTPAKDRQHPLGTVSEASCVALTWILTTYRLCKC